MLSRLPIDAAAASSQCYPRYPAFRTPARRHAWRVLKGVSAGVTSGMTGQDRHHVGINLDVHDELLRGSAILRLPREMPGRGIGMRPPGGPLLGGGGTDERRAVTLAPPAPAGQHLAGGSRETAVAAQ